LDAETLAELNEIRQTTVYPKGAMLFIAGQPARGIFVLCGGRAKLTVTSPRGQSVIVGLVSRGSVLGLDAVLSRTAYQVSAEMLEPAQVNFIAAPQLLRLFQERSSVQTRVAECLAVETRHARTQAARIALGRGVENRLAGLLTELATTARHDTAGAHINLGLTHEEIGALIGTSRETVTRLLNGFRRRGLVRIRDGVVTIPDPARLAAIEDAA
jgi:CRP/FNR family transcriptional regulator